MIPKEGGQVRLCFHSSRLTFPLPQRLLLLYRFLSLFLSFLIRFLRVSIFLSYFLGIMFLGDCIFLPFILDFPLAFLISWLQHIFSVFYSTEHALLRSMCQFLILLIVPRTSICCRVNYLRMPYPII